MKKGFKLFGFFAASAAVVSLASCGSNTLTYKNAQGEDVTTTVQATDDSDKTSEAIYAVGKSYSADTVATNLEKITGVKITLKDELTQKVEVLKDDYQMTTDSKNAPKEVKTNTAKIDGSLIVSDGENKGISGNVNVNIDSEVMKLKLNATIASKDDAIYIDGSLTTKSEGKDSTTELKLKLKSTDLAMLSGLVSGFVPNMGDVQEKLPVDVDDLNDLDFKTVANELGKLLNSIDLEKVKSVVKEYGIIVSDASADTITFGVKGSTALKLINNGDVKYDESSKVEVNVGFSTKYYLPVSLNANINLKSEENGNIVFVGKNSIEYGTFKSAEPKSTDGYKDLSSLFSGLGF